MLLRIAAKRKENPTQADSGIAQAEESTLSIPGITRTFFDPRWRPLPFALHHPRGTLVERPDNLDAMIAIAKKLSEGLDFIRVDLYWLNGRQIVFGELTLTPKAGWARFSPREYDFRLGELW